MLRPPSRGRLALAAALLLTPALVACSGDDGGDGGGGGGLSAEEAIATAQRTFDETSGVEVSLTTDDLPSGATGVTSATGVGVHPAAFEGTFKLSVNGLPADAEVIAVDGTTYARNSLLLPDWTAIDPAEYGAPDPTVLMTPGEGFSAMFAATTGLEKGDSVRGGSDNKEILTEYTGSVPGTAVAPVIPTATGDFEVVYTITDAGELREAAVTGAFVEGEEPFTYVLGLSDYGTEKDIAAP
ncbi:LppX_LprAFG lipoprotein [Nocardioides sp. SYSU D00038]|uniref:LppX_LprAFG lipoprotein n=1 Tax=Nocardioides sp. SYSU D00038 TaxID=2812554 RepID=UPI001967C6C6|nr:LppX_LprAFG lipoprotein [Nocardioides sp. SYSU D00038]